MKDIEDLSPDNYLIAIFNIHVYARGLTGRNYNLVVFDSGFSKKAEANKELSRLSLKKRCKTDVDPKTELGNYYTIKVLKKSELTETIKNSTVIHYTVCVTDKNKLTL